MAQAQSSQEALEDSPSLVQQLFERELGPPQELPQELRADAATIREQEQLEFKVSRGQPLEYQAVPWRGTLMGLNYVPRRPPPRRPGAASQPAHSTLWMLVQPADRLGVNSSLSAVDAGPTGFGGWSQFGFLDVSERAGLEYSLTGHANPSAGVEGEVQLVASTPRLLLLPPLTARHSIAGTQQRGSRLQHATALSAQLGPALARAELREPAPGSPLQPSEGASLKLELLPRSKAVRGLAGGATLQPSCATAFYGSSKGGSEAATATSGSGSSSDSDDEEGGSGSSSSGSASRRSGLPRRRSIVPRLRLELAPGAARGWEDVSSRWQQAWPGAGQLSSTVAYQARQRRWNLSLSHKLSSWLSASGVLVCDAPGAATAAAAGAAGPGAAAAAAGSTAAAAAAAASEIEPAEEPGVSHGALRQLNSHVRGFAAGSKLCRAGLKLHCRLRQPARLLRLESTYDAAGGEGGGMAHKLGVRFGRRPDHRMERAWWDVELSLQPRRRQLALTFDMFAPL